MSRLDIKQMLLEAGFEEDHIAEDHFATPTELPYAAYIYGKTVPFCTDDRILKKRQNVIIELYTKCRDQELIDAISAVLEQYEVIYETAEDAIESEGMYRVSFYFEEMI